MPRKTLLSRPGVTLLIVLLSAIMGQFFLTQKDLPWTLGVGLLFYGLALGNLRGTGLSSPAVAKRFLWRTEGAALAFILLAGLFLRTYHIASMPAGMHEDQGFNGVSTLRILHEGWKPFQDAIRSSAPSYALYFLLPGLALWFLVFGHSYLSFHLFFIVVGLLSFPLLYWTLRQLAGVRTAWLSLFVLSVMRWQIINSRNGFPTTSFLFCLAGATAFAIYGLRKKSLLAFGVSALFCGIGLYTYQAFKVLPLLLIAWWLYERWADPSSTAAKFKFISLFLLVTALLASPLLYWTAREGGGGLRENQLFIWNQVRDQKSLAPLLKNVFQTALMFDREGDTNPRHNLPGHRMLDDVTGIGFVLGLGFLWRRRKERDGFYPLAGLVVMSLPCLLSVDPAHANRMLGVTPWVAYTAARGLEGLWEWVEKKNLMPANWLKLSGILLLAFMAGQNAYTYFIEQAGDERCWKESGVEQTFIGRSLAQLEKGAPGRYRFLLTPAYFHNYTVAFLAHDALPELQEWGPSDLVQGTLPADKDAVFVLEEGKSGVLDFLKTLFPHGQEQTLTDFHQEPLVYLYTVPKESLRDFHGWQEGLRGTYTKAGEAPFRRVDPVLNFTFWKDFPLDPLSAFSVHWEGELRVPATGTYGFQTWTNHPAQVFLDRHLVLDSASGQPASLPLAKGLHSLRVTYEKKDAIPPVFHLVWKPVQSATWEVIPATAFGKPPK